MSEIEIIKQLMLQQGNDKPFGVRPIALDFPATNTTTHVLPDRNTYYFIISTTIPKECIIEAHNAIHATSNGKISQSLLEFPLLRGQVVIQNGFNSPPMTGETMLLLEVYNL